MLTGELQGATDHAAVMAPDREVPRPMEQGLEVLEVGAVNLRARTVRDVRGLFVRSLDKTDPGLFLNQPIDVVGGPLQIRLHADSDSVVPFDQPLADPERVVRRMGVLHVPSRDPLTSEAQEERHPAARTPRWGQIDSEAEAAGPSFTRVSRTTCRT